MFHNMENYRLYFNQPTVEANLLNKCFTMDKINCIVLQRVYNTVHYAMGKVFKRYITGITNVKFPR